MHQDDGFIVPHKRRNKWRHQNQKDSAESIEAHYLTPVEATGPQQVTPVGFMLM